MPANLLIRSTPLIANRATETVGSLGSIVAENYGICRENARRLDAWIDWWEAR